MSTTASESAFRFYNEPFSKVTAGATADCLIAKVPAKVNSKTELLQILSRELRFPLYFGWNWDALSDCLRDMEWLENVRRVKIVHEDLPFLPGWKKRGLYLGLLREAIESWNAQPGIQLEILFPETVKAEVQTLISSESK